MASNSLECPICLDALKNPVATPCGHLSCETCLKSHVRSSPDPIHANCPTCRATFPIVSPDLSLVPKKYHMFISPSVRRVYVDPTNEEGAETIENLSEKVALLEARVSSLQREKRVLIERCENAFHASRKHQEGEKAARLVAEEAKKEMRAAHKKYDAMKEKYQGVKTQLEQSPALNAVKRKSSQAALDSSVDISNVLSSPSRANRIEIINNRPMLRIPKRPRLTPLPFPPYASSSSPAPFGGPPPVFRSHRSAPEVQSDDDDEASEELSSREAMFARNCPRAFHPARPYAGR